MNGLQTSFCGWGQLLLVSLVVMGLAQTIARERVFASLRARLGGKETWGGYLVSCPYCLSHWIAFLLVPMTGTYGIGVVVRWGPAAEILRWFLSSILVAVVSSFFRVLFYYVDETQGFVRRQQKLLDDEIRDR